MAFKSKQKPAAQEPEDFTPEWGNAYGVNQEELPEIIPTVEGKIITIWPSKDFTTKKGDPSSVQNGEMETEHGSIKFTLFGNDELPQTVKGTTLRFSCSKGKGGLGGIEYNINSYDDKKIGTTITNEQLTMSYRCEIEEVGEGTLTQPKPEPKAPSAKAAPASKQVSTPNEFHQEPNGKPYFEDKVVKVPIKYPKTTVVPIEGGLSDLTAFDNGIEAIIAKQSRINDFVRGTYPDLPESTICSYVMNVVITAERRGAFDLDISPIQPAPIPDEIIYDPENWAETIIPVGKSKGTKLGNMPYSKIFEFATWAEENEKTGGFWDCLFNARDTIAISQGVEDLDGIPF